MPKTISANWGIEMKELSNCPFCGGVAKVMTFFDPYVICTKCGSSGIVCEEVEEAVDAWNRRHESAVSQTNDPILEASDWLCELRILIDEYGAAAAIEGKGTLPRHVNRIMKHARAFPFSPPPPTPASAPVGLTSEQREAIEYGADLIHEKWGETMKAETTLRELLKGDKQ